MGKTETASAAIGIKILLSDLVEQINETNFNLIKKMLYDGCIEDSNGYYNEAYKIILGHDEDNIELPQTYKEFKENVTEQFKVHGSYYKSKFSSKVEPDLKHGTLFERYLLVPVNSASRPLDFDLSVDLKIYEDIENFSIIFFVKQHSG